MKTLNFAEFTDKVKNGKPAEMRVNGILRGGNVVDDKFYFCGSSSVGCVECYIDDTLNIH